MPGFWVNLLPFGLPWQRNPPPTRRRLALHSDVIAVRIAATLDVVPFVTMCNLANLDTAMRGGLPDLIEVRLICVGGGPTLDYADATAFLAGFETEGARTTAAMRG
jgi:hypothetical protein